VRTDCENVAKGYNVLAGLVRDLRNAWEDAEGSQTARQLVDSFSDLLELLLPLDADDGSVGDAGEDGASRDDAEDEGDTGDSVVPEERDVRAVDARRIRTASVSGGVKVREPQMAPMEQRQQELPGCDRRMTRGKK